MAQRKQPFSRLGKLKGPTFGQKVTIGIHGSPHDMGKVKNASHPSGGNSMSWRLTDLVSH